MESLGGYKVGVFIGTTTSDYLNTLFTQPHVNVLVHGRVDRQGTASESNLVVLQPAGCQPHHRYSLQS